MMGRQVIDQSQLFYLFNLEEHIPTDHLLRRINPIVTGLLADLREKLAPFYSDARSTIGGVRVGAPVKGKENFFPGNWSRCET